MIEWSDVLHKESCDERARHQSMSPTPPLALHSSPSPLAGSLTQNVENKLDPYPFWLKFNPQVDAMPYLASFGGDFFVMSSDAGGLRVPDAGGLCNNLSLIHI